MADKKITELTEATSVSTDDLLVMVDSPAGGAETKRITVGNLLLSIYPVGAIYISVVDTSPSTLFGGTWSVFGAGKTLVGLDSGQTEFDTVEETGGAKTVAHNHSVYGNTGQGSAQTNCLGGSLGMSNNTHVHLVDLTSGAASDTNNLQPYIVTYMWKRTA